MKRKFLSILLTLAMVLTLLPTAAMAEAPAVTKVAKVGNVEYATLAEAVNAVQDGETVTLLADVTELETISITGGKKVDLNLNEKNITFKADNYFFVDNGALNVTGKGNITSSHGNDDEIWLPTIYAYGTNADTANYSVVTVGKDVVIDNRGSYGLAIGAKDYKAYGAKVIVEGTVTSTYGFTVTGNAKATEGNIPEITVTESGKIVSTDGSAIYAAGYGIYNIAGTLSGTEFGIEIRAGKLNVEDTAKISATGNFSDPVPNGNGSTVTGAAIAVSQHTTNLPIDVNIKGGEISETGTNGHALYEIDTVKNEQAENVAKDVSITVSGGSFNGNVYSTNNKLSISGGAFTDLANAVKYAADNATIKLADDVNANVAIPAGKTITLDLNGKTLNAPLRTQRLAKRALWCLPAARSPAAPTPKLVLASARQTAPARSKLPAVSLTPCPATASAPFPMQLFWTARSVPFSITASLPFLIPCLVRCLTTLRVHWQPGSRSASWWCATAMLRQ